MGDGITRINLAQSFLRSKKFRITISSKKFLRSKNLDDDAARSESLNGCSFARAKRECNVATNKVRRVLDLPIF